jgi:glutathione S-transferase
MIDLYQYKPAWGLLNASPFCMKLEVYLQLAKIPYKTHIVSNPRRAPKGKFPYIKDGEQVIADSSLIIDYLKTKYGDTLDQGLTSIQQAEARAVQALLEEHLYWIIVYSRWIDPAGWDVAKQEFFSSMPLLLRQIIPPLLRRKLRKTLQAQGIGRHSRDEIYALGKEDLIAIANLVYAQPFLFGNKPTSVDACIYAFLSSILYTPINSPLKTWANQMPELNAYCERMKKVLYAGSLVR